MSDINEKKELGTGGATTPEQASDIELGAAKVSWFRGTMMQAIIVGVASFLAPGIYSAMASTGAGGLANVEIGNASVAVAYALIVPSALTATGLISKIGPRWTLVLGACGYAPYAGEAYEASCLYANSAFGNQWGLVVGAVICGATSGWFWVTEGVVIMTYSEPDRKGRLLATWQSIYTLATLVGGAINLALNRNLNIRGGLVPRTYLVFVGLMCAAPFVAALLSNPSQVQRKDRKPVPSLPSEGFWRECWLTVKELNNPLIIACCFLWSQSLFAPSFLSTYLARYFTVRTRGLSSLVIPLLSILIFQLIAPLIDTKRLAVRYKTTLVLSLLQALGFSTMLVVWYRAKTFAAMDTVPLYDWSTPGFAAAWVPVILCRTVEGVSYGYLYMHAGYLFPQKASAARVARIIATLRSAESGSAAVAYGINAVGTQLVNSAIINLCFFGVCIVCGAYTQVHIWREDKKGAFEKVMADEE